MSDCHFLIKCLRVKSTAPADLPADLEQGGQKTGTDSLKRYSLGTLISTFHAPRPSFRKVDKKTGTFSEAKSWP